MRGDREELEESASTGAGGGTLVLHLSDAGEMGTSTLGRVCAQLRPELCAEEADAGR